MRFFVTAAALCLAAINPTEAFAAERSVKLSISGMWCAGCAYMVRQTLSELDGVQSVQVSARDKTALVTFEDSKTTVAKLTDATSGVGFPSTVSE